VVAEEVISSPQKIKTPLSSKITGFGEGFPG
jgi:hypothetical protein